MKYKEALKESFSFYFNNFKDIFFIYLILFIPSIPLYYTKNELFGNLEHLLIYLFLSIIFFIIFYTFTRLTIYFYYEEEKSILKSIKKSIKNYFPFLLTYLITVAAVFISVIISLFISIFISIPFFVINMQLSKIIYIISFIVFSLLLIILFNKIFFSPMIVVFKKKAIYDSLYESWRNIKIKDSALILLFSFLIDSILIITYIIQIYYNNSVYFSLLNSFISSEFVTPIGNLFSIILYKQYSKK
ncbi:hypothetical protein Nps_00715 [Candidatus Nanopusillus acidilobi]|nr:hypothetical protein Nps_00715 [Candidatus Nanopusillus acidilobi]